MTEYVEKTVTLEAIIEALRPGAKFMIVNDRLVWLDDSVPVPTDDEITAMRTKLEDEYTKENLYNKLLYICDLKTREFRNYLNGKTVSDEQLERYEYKYNAAKAYLATKQWSDELSLEADLLGIDVDTLANNIVSTGDYYKLNYTKFVLMIEAYRVKISKLIDNGSYEDAQKYIDMAGSITPDVNLDDMKELFGLTE